MNPVQQLHTLGQSLWYDNIQRRLLENGEMAAMIARGEIRGVTSNPSIFQKAIAESHDYDAALIPLAWSGWSAEQIFWQLAVEDIRAACDLFLPLYTETGGGDGYVSLEVSPYLAHNDEATIAEAGRLWDTVNRPNLMIKIPATKEGLPAIRQTIAAGININVTLIFSIERYKQVMEAYISGLEDRLRQLPSPPGRGAGGEVLASLASVASFFVSRIDTKIDKLLQSGGSVAGDLRGKAAIASARLAYVEFQRVFNSPRFARLRACGARLQRPLWASTSTKNPAYPDTFYVDNLIGPDTVNTVPPQTLEAFRDHGKAELTLARDVDKARDALAQLEAHGISMAQVTQELEDEGVKAFADAFTALLQSIDDRRRAAAAQLGPLSASVSKRVASLEADSVPTRLWAHDPSLWTADLAGQAEIKVRLGWLDLPETSRAALSEIAAFAEEIRKAGIRKFLLFGMGGSSLASDVLSLVFPIPDFRFSILDSTDPAQVAGAAKDFPPPETLYIVSSKSGGTAEVNAMLAYFWELAKGGGSRFIVITDPGTSLEKLARERGFRKVFLADPTVGGRFSAFSHFGLVPAALMGIDLNRLLGRAIWMAAQCRADVPAARNPGLVLGAVLGEAALQGRDKLSLIADLPVCSFGAWLEQLITESSGKQGRGIIIVDGEPLVGPESYADDRLFVYLRQSGKFEAAITGLRAAGHPVLEFLIPDSYSLIPEFYRWEFATAIACHILGVNAFDQPDVQDNKERTKVKITAYSQCGELEEGKAVWEKGGARIYSPSPVQGADLGEVFSHFLATARQHDYVAINAYLPCNEETFAALTQIRLAIRAKTGCATMVGFGPRFLHSTGQLHKGGPGTGLFLQITADPLEDLEIPGQDMTFGTLQRAQALGDYEALVARGRPILRVHLPAVGMVKDLAKVLV